jgi:hypothetical protein
MSLFRNVIQYNKAWTSLLLHAVPPGTTQTLKGFKLTTKDLSEVQALFFPNTAKVQRIHREWTDHLSSCCLTGGFPCKRSHSPIKTIGFYFIIYIEFIFRYFIKQM